MIQDKPPIGTLVRQTYEHRKEQKTRIGRVVGFERWSEDVGGEFDQTGKGEGGVVVVCEYVEPERDDVTFGFGIPNHSVELVDEPVKVAGKALADWIVDNVEDPSLEPVKSLLEAWDRAV